MNSKHKRTEPEGPAVAPLDESARKLAARRQARLTKPAGALGRMEKLATTLAAMQGRECPRIESVEIAVFAADHGVAGAHAVSAYPQAVTAQMIDNMARGGAAISVLARSIGARLQLYHLGTLAPVSPHPAVTSCVIAPASADWTQRQALTQAQLEAALAIGERAAQAAFDNGCDLLIGGEMGIGNTTTAAALTACLLARPAHECAGPGTGLDEAGLARKIEIIEAGLNHNQPDNALAAMRCLGGFELAALTGLYVRAARLGLPVLVDGFPASAAALLACRHRPAVRDWLFAHRSAEPGHAHILEALGAEGLLDLELRLGEGSGAALAVPLLKMACQLHAEMATFDEAGVAD